MIFTVDQLASVVGQAGTLWTPIKEAYHYIEQYSTNIRNVKEKATSLEKQYNELNESLKQNQEKGEEVTEVARSWLRHVMKLLENDAELRRIRDNEDDQSERFGRGICNCRGHNNLYNRYKWSKIAQKKHEEEIEKLLNSFPNASEITRPLPVAKAQRKIAEYMSKSLQSRDDLMDKIVEKLLQDQVHVVGLFGNTLLGKTKMAKDIMKAERVQKEFGKRVALVEVSETPNKKDIQDKMVEVIAKQFEELDDVALRAFLLDLTIQSHPDRKILIILDHMFWKLNLKGFLIDSAKNSNFLVVSREKNVCEEMGAKEDDILEMKQLEDDEARHLFWTQVFPDKEAMVNQVTSWKYVNLGDKLSRDYARCLPLVVKALAKAVKDQNLFQWGSFAKKLADDGHEVFHSISDINIQLLDNKREKKMFFLLACLFPQELSIPIQELMRYAMCLDMIQCVNNLNEAITQANTWAHELISSSLLEADGDSNSNNYILHVFIHHLVWERANSLLVKEKQNFLVPAIADGIPRRLAKSTLLYR